MPPRPRFSAARYANVFPKMRQQRGFELWKGNAVSLDDIVDNGGDLLVLGKVDDPRSRRRTAHHVAVEILGNDEVTVDCSCLQVRHCEHGFALLLAYADLTQDDPAAADTKAAAAPPRTQPPAQPRLVVDDAPDWRQRLHGMRPAIAGWAEALVRTPAADADAAPTPIHYVLPIDACREAKGLCAIALMPTTVDKKPMLVTFRVDRAPRHLAAADRQALLLLDHIGELPHVGEHQSIYDVPPEWIELVLSLMAAHGRLSRAPSLHDKQLRSTPLTLDVGEPFRCATVAERGAGGLTIRGELRRGGETVVADALLGRTHAIVGGRVVRVQVGSGLGLMRSLMHDGPMTAPNAEARELLGGVLAVTAVDRLIEPPVRLQKAPAPETVLLVHMAKAMQRHVPCELVFDYGGRLVEHEDPPLLEPPNPRDAWLERDDAAERGLLDAFTEAHADRVERTGMPSCFLLRKQKLYRDLTAIVASGQRVLADKKPILPSTKLSVSVATGIDWFDVHGEVEFAGGSKLPLAKALLAARRGERLVELGDGRTGVLPEELLERWSPVLELGEAHDDGVRLLRSQALLLDALLAARAADVDADPGFRAYRQRLLGFTGIAPRAEPDGFHGTLRGYQKEGLGWLWFLRELGLGGCLADDMGLGKTVQVLALLLEVHRDRDRPPSLLVVPRSLLDNWREEAQRFAPALRVLDFAGPGRWDPDPGRFAGHDVVLTTYGTLRTDIARFEEREQTFEYAILDEAQAIENPLSVTSKAVRLLRAQHRLALTGTPVQNHIGELWALFEFLSPGLLGRSKTFQQLVGRRKGREVGADLDVLRRALAPFLLRRTKEQVLKELPEKQEQTLHCQLDGSQRRAYDALRDTYRAELLGGGGALDNKERFLALEALLRLRQAACHEGLLDPEREHLPSAKLDALVPMLAEIDESGHKALVFSQFTKFLAIVRTHLDARGIDYEYLDGRTRNRQTKVERFQQDPKCSAFLISLKAGGFGLNLTAADYVFLLDPWWNPAAEAQAVDRAHRIGQTRRVVAYRLVARDTVEDKVLQLQHEKKALVDALLADNASLLAGLDKAQLAALLV